MPGWSKSIFVRLLLVLVATGVVINVMVIACLKFVISPNPSFHRLAEKNVGKYVDFIVADLGTPPRKEEALRLKEELGFDLRVQGNGVEWATSEGLPPATEMSSWPRWRHTSVQLGKRSGRFFIVAEKSGYQYHLFAPGGRYFESRREYTGLLLLLLTLVVGGSYFLLSRLLRPLKWLATGVERISAGDLRHQVPTRDDDELGMLARSFNQMTQSLSRMIQGKEQLLLDVSHELRSPLTRMKVALELTQDPKARELLGDEIEQMEAMIGELLESARLDSPHGAVKRERVSLGPLVAELASHYPRVRISGVTQSLSADIDAERIRTVLKNLVENALKYSSESQPVEISLASDGKRAILEVIDHGEGIPEEDLPRLFEPFFRVDRSRAPGTGGFGLGLSLCRKIVHAHGGEIRVKSRLGHGTIMEVQLPLSPT